MKKSKHSYRIINNKVSITSYGNLKYNETWYDCDKKEHSTIRHLKLRLILEDKHWFEIQLKQNVNHLRLILGSSTFFRGRYKDDSNLYDL